MTYDAEFERRYARSLSDCPLPETAADAYELLECLRQSREKAAWLVRDRQSGGRCVLKIAYGGQRRFLRAEWDCLTALKDDRSGCFPQPLRYEQDEGCSWLARSWEEGQSLAALVDEQGFLSEEQTVGYGMALCDALNALHAHGYICRDVKPENIVVTPSRRVMLIDCDAARRYDSQKARDTVFVVSYETAAPEQYGFSQSDVRTDIYAVGRTLIYMACGSYHSSKLDSLRVSRRLRRILRRAASPQPERRYPSAEALKTALQGCRSRRVWPWITAAALLIAVLSAGAAAVVWRAAQPAGAPVTPVSADGKAREESMAAQLGLPSARVFRARDYQDMLDELLARYAARDKAPFADACEALITALYADPALLQGEKVDYALISPLPADFFDVTPVQAIDYGLWYSDETLRRNLGAYRDYAAHFLRVMDDDLSSAALGEKISSIYTYLDLPMERRDEVLSYALSDIVTLLGRAIDTPPP